jgi:hypothetical protein
VLVEPLEVGDRRCSRKNPEFADQKGRLANPERQGFLQKYKQGEIIIILAASIGVII